MRTQPRTSPILAGLTLGLMTLSTASSAELPAALDVHRAVGVSWQTEDGHQYQVEATTDLQTWGPVGPVVTGDGKSRTHYDDAANPGTFYRVKTIPGLSPKWFPGLKELLTESASVTGSGSSLELRNLRLVTPKSTKGSAFTGLPLNYRALESGTHYLFIDHADGVRDVAYSGNVTIGN